MENVFHTNSINEIYTISKFYFDAKKEEKIQVSGIFFLYFYPIIIFILNA